MAAWRSCKCFEGAKLAEICGIFNHLFFDSGRPRPYHGAPMSTHRIPRQADFRKLAASGSHIGGVVLLGDLERIREELLDRDGFVSVALDFGVDDEGYRVISGRIEAVLDVQCQRCLGRLALAVAAEMQLAMVWRDEELAALPRRFDGIVVGEEPGDLFELIEDELLLALPFAPVHPEGECEVQDGDGRQVSGALAADAEQSDNPFAVLAGYRERPH